MGSIDPLHRMPQICLEASRKAGCLYPAVHACAEDRNRSQDAYCSALINYLGGQHVLPYTRRYVCAHPVLVPNQFLASLKEFHVALSTALTNIVERWVVDEEADFPSRMPLEKHEEDIIRWIHHLTQNRKFPEYKGHQGNWRPDFLLPADEIDTFKICEVNARFPSNGIDLTSWIYQSLDNPDIMPPNLDVAGSPEHMMNCLRSLFSTDSSLHVLQEHERHPMVEAFVRNLSNLNPRLVKPQDLRLVPDSASPTGYRLRCTKEPSESGDQSDGELEDIQQMALRLFVHEFASLAPEMQRQLAFLSAHDIRSILIVHDKRILGILLHELDDLVTKHHVLTQRQADLLRERVIFTILPGSKDLQQLTTSYHQGKVSKDGYILKPIRSGRGQGIILSRDLSVSEWEAILMDMKNPALSPDRTLYVIQPVLKQAEGDMFLDEQVGVQRTQRVGTYHSMHGEFAALGAWRVGISTNRYTNMQTGDSWKMGSVVTKMN